MFFDVVQPHRLIGGLIQRPIGADSNSRFVMDPDYLSESSNAFADEMVTARNLGVGAGSAIATKTKLTKDQLNSFELNKTILDSCIGPLLSQMDKPLCKYCCIF